MTALNQRSKKWPVLFAAAVIVALAGSLGARLIARNNSSSSPRAPDATVPDPVAFEVTELEVPCWSCPGAENWPIRFRTDLDLLAPLGNGTANAAEWFALFAKVGGPRGAEAIEASDARIEVQPEWVGKVFPPNHPLLLEAEPWVDQATMSFYPDIFELNGYATRITNLLFMLNLARSWVARGIVDDDTEVAMADFRRAIRLGRLLRQEDVVVISDLVGLECVRLGARGVYERALADGDSNLALLASVVLGEVAPQKLGTKKHLTTTDLVDSFERDSEGEVIFRLRSGKLDTLIEAARNSPDRRFRCEAVLGLNIVRSLGTPEEQHRSQGVLEDLVGDADRKVAIGARWCVDNLTSVNELKKYFLEPIKVTK
jgi:hypothetical protein